MKRGNDQLIELHDRLYSGALAVHLSTEYIYIPHLTVGRLSNKAAFLSALEEVRKVSTTLQSVIEDVTVYELDQDPYIEFNVRL